MAVLKTAFLGLARPQHGINEVEGETATGTPNEAANLDAIDAAIMALSNFDISAFFAGKPGNSAVVLEFVATRAFGLAAAFANSKAVLGTAATASTVLTVTKNGSSIGTITFGASGTTGTFAAASATEFAAGDILQIVAPSSADSSAANIGITLVATRG